MKKTPYRVSFSFIVAESGFAPGSSGYEPDEILLLYPAINDIIHNLLFIAIKTGTNH